VQYVHDVRALLSNRAAEHRAAAEPRTEGQIDPQCLERAYADGPDEIRGEVA
jgi:hypothetical protein